MEQQKKLTSHHETANQAQQTDYVEVMSSRLANLFVRGLLDIQSRTLWTRWEHMLRVHVTGFTTGNGKRVENLKAKISIHVEY